MNTNLGTGAAISAAERSQRSVFVGNIPYEATEDELKQLFSQVGPVVGFRLVVDRETGKPKGYGFCEFADQETAMSALRNLNQFEFHGRSLRVDTAAGDRSKEELRQLQLTFGGPQEESPYGPPCESAKAPEAISRAVASLPPEQMFELMKQMKLCIQNNPNEARNMLLQNPQLAYALLQAQVVMRIVDPQVAMSMLHRDSPAAQSVAATPLMMPPVQNTMPIPPSVPSSMAPPSRDIDYRMIPGAGPGMPPFTGPPPMPMPPRPVAPVPPVRPMAPVPTSVTSSNEEQERDLVDLQYALGGANDAQASFCSGNQCKRCL
uniref:RRM domain-containing protein n=1 Tax=Romanomermis culicivorax TaxID=13658 RepID=A0A915J874_ROMCU